MRAQEQARVRLGAVMGRQQLPVVAAAQGAQQALAPQVAGLVQRPQAAEQASAVRARRLRVAAGQVLQA